jgi:hypothetical protein
MCVLGVTFCMRRDLEGEIFPHSVGGYSTRSQGKLKIS